MKIPTGCRIFTPPQLADALVGAVAVTEPKSWLEPSFGEGAFLRSLESAGYDKAHVLGLELSKARVAGLERAATCRYGTEALAWMRTSRRRFDAVIANPPYAAGVDLDDRIKHEMSMIIDPSTKERLSGAANLWLGFLLGSLRLLNRGGSLGFILPASWDYASYARGVRGWLAQQFEVFSVIRSDTPLFDEVTEGCVVLVGHRYGEPHKLTARLECLNRNSVCAALGRLPSPWPSLEVASNHSAQHGSTLRDFVDLRLGGVTGQSSYFVMRESERKKRGLPIGSLRPVVTKARHLRSGIIDRRRWAELKEQDEPVWLFAPAGEVLKNAAVKSYLSLRPDRGGCYRSRAKIRGRNPWYTTPLPSSVHGFISGMDSDGPKIVFSGMKKLSATNTIYTVSFKRHVPLSMRYGLAKWLLSEEARSAIRGIQRKYAGGLRKLEPGDILEIRVPSEVSETTLVDYERSFRESLNSAI